MPRRYAILDVFSAEPLAGNPLAVVLDAEGLSTESMQAIAAEFALSETVFVLRAVAPFHSAALRIFTPRAEVPFAGHPTIGTAVLLAMERGLASGDTILVLEEGIGPVRCGVTIHDDHGHAWFDAPRLPAEAHAPGSRAAIAGAVGLDDADIGFEHHTPTTFDAGLGFVFVPVASLAAIARARPETDAWQAAFGDRPAYLYTRETELVGRQFHARMFAPTLGIAEDPATGSAAVAFAAVLHRFDAHPAGTHTLLIEQGFEMGRPSIIQLEVDIEPSGLAAVRVGGAAVLVARGELLV